MRRFVLIAAAAFLVACHRPPILVTQHGSLITVDVQTLGEYPSDVARLRLIDASSRHVVWELKGHGDPQLGKFVLNAGNNPVTVGDIRHGTYVVVTPVSSQAFKLAGGGTYILEAWGRDDDPTTKRQAEFTVPR
jgi:hypothetical protein